jgi:hypothetical protein
MTIVTVVLVVVGQHAAMMGIAMRARANAPPLATTLRHVVVLLLFMYFRLL